MDNDNFNKRLSEFFKRPIELIKLIGGLIIFLLSLLTAVVKFIKLLEGDTGLVTMVLIFVSIGILLSLFLYIYLQFRKRRTAYSQWIRRTALTCFIAVLILPLAGYAIWKYYPSDKIIVLVADFDGIDKKKYWVTGNIVKQLREATKKYPDVQVKVLPETITYEQRSDYARTLGKKHKATIVLWGEYVVNPKMVQVNVHFEVLRKPRYLELRQEEQTLNLAIAELESFTIQEQLSHEMSYLTLLTIGLARYEAEDYDGAIARFTSALAQTVPEQMVEPAAIYFYRGTAYNFKGAFDHAINDYNLAVKLKPTLAEAYSNRGLAYAVQGDFDCAIADFNQAIEFSPDYIGAYINRGAAYADKDDFDRAIADYDKAIAKAIEFKLDLAILALAYINRGAVYADKDDFDRAIADYNQAIKLKPDLAEAYSNRGSAYYSKGDYDLAIADYDKTIELNPNTAILAKVYSNRGAAYADKDDFDRAIADYSQAIKLNPVLAEAYFNRGLAYVKKGDFDSAIVDFDQAIALNPDDAEIHVNRGLAYAEQGHFDSAIADFDQAIAVKPNYTEAYLNRGSAYASKGDFDSAIADYSQAIKLKPNYVDAYFGRGLAYKIKGDKDKAIADFKKVLELTNDPGMRQLVNKLQELDVE